MADQEQLVQELAGLDDTAWIDFLEKVRQERSRRARQMPLEPIPGVQYKRLRDLAGDIALQHLGLDPGIIEVVYLPTGAPENEIRLLEVNRLANVDDPKRVVPFHYRVDLEGMDFHGVNLFVADVTPEQWRAILRGELALPVGWELSGNVSFA